MLEPVFFYLSNRFLFLEFQLGRAALESLQGSPPTQEVFHSSALEASHLMLVSTDQAESSLAHPTSDFRGHWSTAKPGRE